MKSIAALLVATAAALIALPAAAAFQLAQSVDYLPGAAPNAACAWEPSLLTASGTASNGAASAASPRLSLRVAQLKLSPGSRKSEYGVTVRADIADASGRLLATRDFQDERSFANADSGCDALRALGASLGANVATWATQTRLIDCAEACDGIHPDQPIIVGKEVLIGDDDALNDTVRNDCRYQTAMIRTLLTAVNDADPPPRARLEAGALDPKAKLGRRLLLRVMNVHALGGGGWSGPKWMDLAGELYDGKTLVGSFESHTTSGRGLTTCKSVESLSESSADLIADWLRNPSLGARLN
ncbi:MAG: hypothetical protein ABI781_00955 [Burkholderiales bacterium]